MKDTDNHFEWLSELHSALSKGLEVLKDAREKRKARNQPPLSKDKERIEVLNVSKGTSLREVNLPMGYYNKFCVSKEISEDKFPAIKLLLERFLNNEYTINADGSWTVHSHNQKTDTVVEDKGLKTGIMSQMDMYQMGYKDGAKYGNPDNKAYTGNKCTCKVGEPYNSIACPVHGNFSKTVDVEIQTPNQPEKTVTDNSDVACLSLNDVKEFVGKYESDYCLEQLQQKVTQKLKTHTP